MNSAQDTLAGGLPHSEIPGSTIARISPGLFAACHVLHRLSVPRHPPDALSLRLSATPNGKHHPDTRIQVSELRSTPVRQTLLSEDTTGSHRQSARQTGLAAAHGFPPRSHNSLLYDLPSTTHPGFLQQDAPGQFRSAAASRSCVRYQGALGDPPRLSAR